MDQRGGAHPGQLEFPCEGGFPGGRRGAGGSREVLSALRSPGRDGQVEWTCQCQGKGPGKKDEYPIFQAMPKFQFIAFQPFEVSCLIT